MLTTVAAGRVFDFSHAVGRGSISGEGFRLCVALAAGEGDTIYAQTEVLSTRGGELIGPALDAEYAGLVLPINRVDVEMPWGWLRRGWRRLR